MLGAWLGQFEWVGNNIDIIFIVIVLISVIPIFIEIGRGFMAKRRAAAEGTDPVEEFIEEHEGGKHGEH
ncbi:hypothetical protein D3C73_1416770 [compost metagenome]